MQRKMPAIFTAASQRRRRHVSRAWDAIFPVIVEIFRKFVKLKRSRRPHYCFSDSKTLLGRNFR